jgi:hypothetical protein
MLFNPLDDNHTALIEQLAQTDPIVKHVWEHYFVNKKTEPLGVTEISHFWKKTSGFIADVDDVKKKLTN